MEQMLRPQTGLYLPAQRRPGPRGPKAETVKQTCPSTDQLIVLSHVISRSGCLFVSLSRVLVSVYQDAEFVGDR